MRNVFKVLFFSLGFIFLDTVSLNARACDLRGHSGFMPENNLRIPVGEEIFGGITEAEFNKVMDKMEFLFSPVVKKTGKRLVIERRWKDPTVNAFAHQNVKGVDTIVMYGGMARHSEITMDSMALVACHELGHHLAGAPRKVQGKEGNYLWASNEGQADYWGAMKCLRHYFENEDNIAAVMNLNISVPADVVKKCEFVYKRADSIATCEREAMAGLSLGRLLNSIQEDGRSIDFTTPDRYVVVRTLDSHPNSQCRLDTYYQGALCDHDFSESISMTDPNIGVCSLRNGDRIGNRPLCWFKP